MDQRHGHTAGEHRRHLGGMASGKVTTTIFASRFGDFEIKT
jgi:hypothetical protein